MTTSIFKKPALILGNGPSAKVVDFDNLSSFDSFGMNAAYRYWHNIGKYPQYYSCLDLVVGLSHKDEILDLVSNAGRYGIRKFLLRDNLISQLKGLVDLSRIVNFDEIRNSVEYLKVAPVTTGSHTLAWAALLGYTEAYIIGVDCDYVQIIDEASLLDDGTLVINETPSKAENYFFDDYQQAGDHYNVPDPSDDLHISAWRLIASVLPKGIVVKNVNPNSKMDAFPFGLWDELLKNMSRNRSILLRLKHLFENHSIFKS